MYRRVVLTTWPDCRRNQSLCNDCSDRRAAIGCSNGCSDVLTALRLIITCKVNAFYKYTVLDLLYHGSLLKFRTVLLNLPASVFFLFLTCMTGLTVFAHFARSGCDPLANHDIDNPNQVIFTFVLSFTDL